MAQPAPALVLENVSRRFGAQRGVENVSLELHPGQITALLGPSGCGKTTLLRLIAGLERPDTGVIRAGERLLAGPGFALAPEHRRIGLVFQDFSLFPHLTAAQNVAFGLRHLPRARQREQALALLEQFGLGARADAFPHSLSGGEAQRVAIARALAPKPDALLLDEPFSGLDAALRTRLREEVLSALRKSGVAMLMVTHDAEEALLAADRLALMHEGQILQCGSPVQCYREPASATAAAMLGPVSLVPATVLGGMARCAFGQFPAGGRGNGAALAVLRPEALVEADEGVRAQVLRVRFAGAFHEVHVLAGGCEAQMRTMAAPPLPGETMRIAIRPEAAALVLLGEAGGAVAGLGESA